LIVLDASAVLELLLGTPPGRQAADRIFAPQETACAPELLDLEVAQVLGRYERQGDLSPARASQALEDLADLRLERYPHSPLLPRIWELRGHLSAYDAAYVALAEALPAPLLTADGRLARAAHGAEVVLLE
jgi:predicted nucleic acid-binding protein